MCCLVVEDSLEGMYVQIIQLYDYMTVYIYIIYNEANNIRIILHHHLNLFENIANCPYSVLKTTIYKQSDHRLCWTLCLHRLGLLVDGTMLCVFKTLLRGQLSTNIHTGLFRIH